MLNLILPVVPDGRACLHAAVAALSQGGRAAVLDNLAPPTGGSVLRRVVNVATTRLGTDVTRPVEPCSTADATIVHGDPTLAGLYRILLSNGPPDRQFRPGRPAGLA